MTEQLIIDLFAGGGGASTGIEMALGRSPDIAVNHDATAIAMHTANHPDTLHVTENVYKVNPADYTGGKPVGLMWASPDCRHHSRARGGAPVSESVRSLAWSIPMHCRQLGANRPIVILMENVKEFRDWGPLIEDENGKLVPDPARKGETYREWKRTLRSLGYRIDERTLRACDYGAPTIRERLFIAMRRDGQPIVWPEPTHGAPNSKAVATGKLKPWRTAAEIIDWSLPCPSIFDTSEEIMEKHGLRAVRPLAEKTQARIAAGVKRYVLDAAEPFIVPFRFSNAARGVDLPLPTVTANSFEKRPGGAAPLGVVVPTIANLTHGIRMEEIDAPLRTVTSAHRGEKAILAPTLVQTGYGERNGQAPRSLDLQKPLGTVVSGGGKHALVAAFLAQHNLNAVGRKADAPLATVTTTGAQTQLVAAHLTHFYSSNTRGGEGDPRSPLKTVTAGGLHAGLVHAFMVKYYGAGIGQTIDEPAHSVTTKDRFGLVTVQIAGETYAIVDIGMRMLTPRELFRAQGFPDDYEIDHAPDGSAFTKTDKTHKVGNSVCPPLAAALAAANCAFLRVDERKVAA